MMGIEAVREAWAQRRNYPGEAISIELPADFEQLAAFKAEVDAVAAAAREVSQLCADHMISYLGDQGHAKLGVTFYKVSAKKTVKIRPDAMTRFFAWVDAHPGLADRLFNPNLARATGLTHMRSLPDPETGELMERADWDEAFLVPIEPSNDLKLDEIPESKMYKWQLRLPDGSIQRVSADQLEKGHDDGATQL